MKNTSLIYLSLLLVTGIWGGSFSAIKHLLNVFSPTELIVARFLPAAIIFAIIALLFYFKEVINILRNDFLKILTVGILGIPAYHFSLNYGETTISAGLASLIIGLNPSLTFILSVILLKENIRWTKLLGLLISFAGLYILVRYGSGEALSYSYLLAVFITILSPVCWALYTTISKPLTMKYSPIAVGAVSTTLGTIPSLIFVTSDLAEKMINMKIEYILSLGFLSLLATVLGTIVWMSGVKRISATRVSSFVYFVPLSAVIIGIVFLRESLNVALVMGGILIMSGVWITNKKSDK